MARAIADAAARIPFVDVSFIGEFVRQEGRLAVVDVGGTRLFDIPNVGDTVPYVGQPVRLGRWKNQTLLLGPSQPGWPVGEVLSAGAGRAVVQVPNEAQPFDLGCIDGVSPTPGETVVIDWRIPLVVGTVDPAVLPDTIGGDDPEIPGGTHRLVFTAIDTGSYRSANGWWTPEVYDSVSNTGAAFYGSKISDTIQDSATITAILVNLPALQIDGDPPVLNVHSSSGKPGGNVSFVGPTDSLGARSGWVALDLAIGDALKVAPRGIGFQASTGGFNIWRGLNTDGQAFALDITWED